MTLVGSIPRSAAITIPGRHVWCCAPALSADGRCHALISTWPESAGFEAWVTHSEVWHAEAPSPAGPFTVTGPVLAGSGGAGWDGRVVHNPCLLPWDGRWVVVYMGTTGPDLPPGHATADATWWAYRNRQRIGVAVADHPRGPWTRLDRPLIDVEPEGWVHLMTSNPAVARAPDGSWRMLFKTVEAGPAPFGGRVLHAVATAASPLGPWTRAPEPVFTAAGVRFPVEDPCLWWRDGAWHAIVSDHRGTFTGAGRSWARFRSCDGVAWEPAAQPLVARLELPWADGAVEPVERFERPQVLLVDGAPRWIAGAAKRGAHSCAVIAPWAG
jgi:hypothetical protein